MRTHTYTKAVLTIIMLLLAVIAFKPLVTPATTASAQGTFAGVQFSFEGANFTAFDTRPTQSTVRNTLDIMCSTWGS